MARVKIENLQYLQIGVQGENAANSIEIDMTSWDEELAEEGVSYFILFKAYNSEQAWPAVAEYDAETHTLLWTVTLAQTAVVGVGYTEVRALNTNGLIKKSRIVPTTVEESVTGLAGGTVPYPYDDWMNLVLGYKQDSEAWAVGTRDGQAVSSDDETYHNNAKYYAENYAGSLIDDTSTAADKVWSASKTSSVTLDIIDDTSTAADKVWSASKCDTLAVKNNPRLTGSVKIGSTATVGSGNDNMAAGTNAYAWGDSAFSLGKGTTAQAGQFSIGKYNESKSSSSVTSKGIVAMVGFGSSDTSRKNIVELDNEGNLLLKGNLILWDNTFSNPVTLSARQLWDLLH